jgi:hypothetical protein
MIRRLYLPKSIMRKFVNHKVRVDFDWSHNHTNESNGRSFKIGTVHVQEWNMGKDGEFHRISEKARFMSNKEMKSMVRLSKLFVRQLSLDKM